VKTQELELSVESSPDDVVIPEIDRLQSQIESDTTITGQERAALLQRVAIERQSYMAWLARYASFFRQPRAWTPELAPIPSDQIQRRAKEHSGAEGDRPRVVVFADFGGYTHRIDYPHRVDDAPDPVNIASMISGSLYAFMQDWSTEFSRYAWDDAMCGKHGTMLWVPFDIQGMSIARSIKLSVGEAARIFYLKPSEDPFARYDYAREMLCDRMVPSDEYPSPTRSQSAAAFDAIDSSLIEPDPTAPPVTVRLLVRNGFLYFPFGGHDFDAAGSPQSSTLPVPLARLYHDGSRDSIPFPFPTGEEEAWRERLAYALYEERRFNDFFPRHAVIELPDATQFDVYELLKRKLEAAAQPGGESGPVEQP
jgi:hypothetical protein